MQDPILSITAIAEVFPDGQKITAAAVEFDREIDTENLSPALLSVKDRTVTRVYANTVPSRTTHGKNGKFVILELSLEDPEARVLPEPGPGPGGPIATDALRDRFPGFHSGSVSR